MRPRYDTWPETVTCSRCGDEYDAPTREEMYDSVGSISTLCGPCDRREDFFRLVQLHRVTRRQERERLVPA